MILTNHAQEVFDRGSAIRDMFLLAKKFRSTGKNPIDLSLGNPDIKPPVEYYHALRDIVDSAHQSELNSHGYIPSVGLPATRTRVAADLADKFGLNFTSGNVIITAGAANALDVLLMTLIEPDTNPKDEVIVIAPFFVEYNSYTENNKGKLVVVNSDEDTFDLDLDAIAEAITPRTRALIINSPHNPTGKVYSSEKLAELAEVLRSKNQEYGITIACLEDSPYSLVVFGGREFASILPHYQYGIHVNSFSKSLGVAGERIGYLAVHPELGTTAEINEFMTVAATNLRTKLVNAPALQQRVITEIGCYTTGDLQPYEQRVNRLAKTLSQQGFEFPRPEGAFYLFAELPLEFDTMQEFTEYAHRGNDPLIFTPGAAFGGEKYAHHLRFSACVSSDEIERACDKIERICAERRAA